MRRSSCTPFSLAAIMRAQVGEILRDVARRILARAEQRDGFLLAQAPCFDQQEVVDQHAFLLHHLLSGGIEPGVMPPISA